MLELQPSQIFNLICWVLSCRCWLLSQLVLLKLYPMPSLWFLIALFFHLSIYLVLNQFDAVILTNCTQMTNTIQKKFKVSSTQLLYQSCPYQAITLFVTGPFLDGLLTNQNVFAFKYTSQVVVRLNFPGILPNLLTDLLASMSILHINECFFVDCSSSSSCLASYQSL